MKFKTIHFITASAFALMATTSQAAYLGISDNLDTGMVSNSGN